MPFIAEADGETVIPESVPDGSDVMCRACDGVMRPRGPFADGTARHFCHLPGTDCSGGESDIHRLLGIAKRIGVVQMNRWLHPCLYRFGQPRCKATVVLHTRLLFSSGCTNYPSTVRNRVMNTEYRFSTPDRKPMGRGSRDFCMGPMKGSR